jgi:hypothetical protein
VSVRHDRPISDQPAATAARTDTGSIGG